MKTAAVCRREIAVVKLGPHLKDRGAERQALYPVPMRYRAEVYRTDSDELLVNVGHWETRREAVMACEEHALQTLVFEEHWPTCWEARATVYWYRIRVTPD